PEPEADRAHRKSAKVECVRRPDHSRQSEAPSLHSDQEIKRRRAHGPSGGDPMSEFPHPGNRDHWNDRTAFPARAEPWWALDRPAVRHRIAIGAKFGEQARRGAAAPVPLVPVYLSHSYRREDRDVND